MNKIFGLMLGIMFVLISSAYARTAFLKYDRISGFNRICVYDDHGSDVVITISSMKFCPFTIKI